MHKNKLWLFLLAVVGVSALWYSFIAGYRYYNFSRLDTQIAPTNITWNVIEHSSSSYTLIAKYQFIVGNKTFYGSTDLTNDTFLNLPTAESSINKTALLPWKVWYDKDDPHHSSLQKDFPFKEYVYAMILWGIFLYFIWLGFYIGGFKT